MNVSLGLSFPLLPMESTRRDRYLFPLLIIITTFAAYWNSLYGGLIWDDFSVLTPRVIEAPTLGNILELFYEKNAYNAPGEIFRPLYPLSYALDHYIYGGTPFGYHLTNVIMHAVNSLLVFALAARLFAARAGSSSGGYSSIAPLVVALVFALHPVHIDSVAWIKSRDDLLLGFFFFSSLLLFLRFTGFNRAAKGSVLSYILSLVCFFFALMSKETAAVLPMLLVLIYIAFKDTIIGAGGKSARWWAPYLPFFILLFIYIGWRSFVLGQMAQSHYIGGGLAPALFTMARGFAVYLKLLVWPFSLCGDYYGFPVSTTPELRVVLSALLLAVTAIAGLLCYRSSRLVFVAVLWFYITLAPVSNIIPLKVAIAERFLYLPLFGAALLLGLLAARLIDMGKVRVVAVALALLTLAFIYMTFDRNKVWHDEFVFWEDVIKNYPSARAYTSYGFANEEAGKINEAEKYYKLALSLEPNFAYAINNLGAIYLGKKDFNNAALSFERAVFLEPKNSYLNVNLGRAYEGTGRYDDALKYYEKAVELDPRSNYASGYLFRLRRALNKRP